MSEKPILFSGEMVRAIQAGRKTQTRRIIKHQPSGATRGEIVDKCVHWFNGYDHLTKQCELSVRFLPRDRLWVKETHIRKASGTIYRADFDGMEAAGLGGFYGGWKPSIFCRRVDSRLTLEIESTGVERLNEISKTDAIAEGVDNPNDPVGEYSLLWESIHGKGSWKRNPWVWVVTFKRVFNNQAKLRHE